MIVLLEATFPGTKTDEIVAEWLESLKTDPPPEYVKMIDLYALAAGDGLRTLMFYDVEKGKEDEGVKYLTRGVVRMLKAIEGYREEVRVVYNMAEAFEILGMKAPAV